MRSAIRLSIPHLVGSGIAPRYTSEVCRGATTAETEEPLSHHISPTQALAHLRGLVRALDTSDSTLRSTSGARVSNLVARLKPSDLEPALWHSSKLEDTTPSKVRPSHTPEIPLLYVVNFADSTGYAILSADSRIPEPVLCITEGGHISAEEFSHPPTLILEPIRSQEIQGPSLYNTDCDDYYVGTATAVHDMASKSRQEVLIDIVRTYARDCTQRSSSHTEAERSNAAAPSDGWETTDSVHALLKTKWHQGAPFNDLAPIKRRYFVSGPKERCLAGCLPIAVAQIMACHGIPHANPLVWPNAPIPWDEMRSTCTSSGQSIPLSSYTERQRKALATLLRWIGDNTLVVYNSLGSFGLPRNARKFLARQGYRNVDRHAGYNEGVILEMLKGGKPVIFSSVNTRLYGHAWVIDGYQKQERTRRWADQGGKPLCSMSEQRILVHCNFGWGGIADGYYASGIFDTRRPAEIYDSVDTRPQTSDAHYRWHHSTISYDLP